MYNCVITSFSKREHVAQIITGYICLKKEGYLSLKIVDKTSFKQPYYDIPLILVEINGIKIIYDCDDGYPEQIDYDWMTYYLPKVDYYFKRSFDYKMNEVRYPEFINKMFPLGLNYYVSCPHNPFNFKYRSFKFRVEKIMKIAFYHDTLWYQKNYEKKFDNKDKPKICFMTRLWSENMKDVKESNQRRVMNEMRINLIRCLKEKYGSDFVGGLYDSKLANEKAPDLILPKKITVKSKYYSIMNNCSICIATTGIRNSIGWKFAEYLLAGKIVLTEPLLYSLPKSDIELKYYEFDSIEQCVSLIEKILQMDDEAKKQVIKNNYEYCKRYILPSSIIKNSINTIFNSDEY